MSFVYAEKSEITFEDETISSTHIYGDTKIELDGAVRMHWPEQTRRAVSRYGMSKVTIPGPGLSVAFAGNNLLHVTHLFDWMEGNNPFEFDDLLGEALRIHRSASDQDEVEFILCAADAGLEQGEIVCIKEGSMRRQQELAWIGSPQTFRKMQELRLKSLTDGNRGNAEQKRTDSFGLFAEAIRSGADDSVGGFVVNVILRDGEFHFNDYLFTQVYKSQVVGPGESVMMIDLRQNGGYTVEACELDGCPCFTFPQIERSIIYTNKYRYEKDALQSADIRHFMLPMLFNPTNNRLEGIGSYST